MRTSSFPVPTVPSSSGAMRPAPVQVLTGPPKNDFSLPRDLREWVGSSTLVDWVQAEAEHLGAGLAEPPPGLRRLAYFPPKTLLRLLAFAYAIEVFSSEEIVRNCSAEAAFRLICGDCPPFAAELSAFRRRHRDLVGTALANLFLRALRHRHNAPQAVPTAKLWQRLKESAFDRVDVGRHMDVCDF